MLPGFHRHRALTLGSSTALRLVVTKHRPAVDCLYAKIQSGHDCLPDQCPEHRRRCEAQRSSYKSDNKMYLLKCVHQRIYEYSTVTINRSLVYTHADVHFVLPKELSPTDTCTIFVPAMARNESWQCVKLS